MISEFWFSEIIPLFSIQQKINIYMNTNLHLRYDRKSKFLKILLLKYFFYRSLKFIESVSALNICISVLFCWGRNVNANLKVCQKNFEEIFDKKEILIFIWHSIDRLGNFFHFWTISFWIFLKFLKAPKSKKISSFFSWSTIFILKQPIKLYLIRNINFLNPWTMK